MNNKVPLMTACRRASTHRAHWSLGRLSGFGGLMAGLWLAMACVSAPLMAQIERQHGAHVHGQGSGTMALDEQAISLSLEMPGFNVVGFEHPPTSQAQRAEIETALMIFKTGQWLNLDPQGRCVVSQTSATAEGYDPPADDGEAEHHHSHGHDDNHNHNDHHDHEGDHAYFEVNVEAVCAAPDDLAWVEINLFASFPNNERITLDVLTQTGALQARLDANTTRVDLK